MSQSRMRKIRHQVIFFEDEPQEPPYNHNKMQQIGHGLSCMRLDSRQSWLKELH